MESKKLYTKWTWMLALILFGWMGIAQAQEPVQEQTQAQEQVQEQEPEQGEAQEPERALEELTEWAYQTSGEYKVTSNKTLTGTIVLSGNLTLHGTGDVEINKGQFSGSMFKSEGPTLTFIGSHPTDRFTLDGCATIYNYGENGASHPTGNVHESANGRPGHIIELRGPASLYMTNTRLQRGWTNDEDGQSGGAILADNTSGSRATLQMTNCVVRGCYSVRSGSALTFPERSKYDATLEDCYFHHCYAYGIWTSGNDDDPPSYGGTIRSYGGTKTVLTIKGCEIHHNYSGWHGGGIAWNGSGDGDGVTAGKLTITSSTGNGNTKIYDNETARFGGGIYIGGSASNINHCDIYDNSAGYGGGGIAVVSYSGPMAEFGGRGPKVTLRSDITIRNNSAGNSSNEGDGGGVLVLFRASDYTGFDENYGTLTNDSSYLSIQGSNIFGNTANRYGGGVCVYDKYPKKHRRDSYVTNVYKRSVIIQNGDIYNNTAEEKAGGVAIIKANTGHYPSPDADFDEFGAGTLNVYLKGGNIYNNTCSDGIGGGIAIYDSFTENNTASSTCNVKSSGSIKIYNNRSAGNGGGIHLQSANLKMTAGTIGGNLGANGAASPNIAGYTSSRGGNGGGVAIIKGDFDKTGGTISRNQARKANGSGGNGGGFYASNGKVDVGGTVSYNTAVNGGGGYVTSNSNVTISGTFKNNQANRPSGDNSGGHGGGFVVTGNGQVTISGVVGGASGEGNTATHNGGGFYISGGARLNMASTVSNNTARYGGGGYVMNGEATLQNGTNINNNIASIRGGGFYVTDGTVNVKDGALISYNTVTTTEDDGGDGGGFCATGASNVTLENCSISHNQVPDAGGGFYVSGSSSVTVKGTVDNNTAGVGGGGYMYSGNVYLQSGTNIHHNTATTENGGSGEGGGIKVYQGSLTYDSGDVADNTAKDGGGIYLSANGIMRYTNGNVTRNIASQDGGGIYVYRGNLTYNGEDNFNITYNNASRNGGGIYMNGGALTQGSGSTVGHNTATVNGGGLYATEGDGAMTLKGKFDTNTAVLGGGAYILNRTVSQTGCRYLGNIATMGGGLHLLGGSLNSVNGNFSNNQATAGHGGGLYAITIGAVTENGTVINNTATGNGGGMYVLNSSLVTLSGLINNNQATGTFSSAGETTGFGGGVYAVTTGNVSMDGTVHNNTAVADGGGMYVLDCNSLTVEGTVSNNHAYGTAGSEGETTGYGGGIYASGTGLVTVTGAANGGVISNSAVADGGGLYVTPANNGEVRLTGTVRDNTAINGAGAYTNALNNHGTITYYDGQVFRNIASNNGGGFYTNGGTTNINGGTIGGTLFGNCITGDGNKAINGAGIYIANAGTLNTGTCTVSANMASNQGGGIYVEPNGTADATNTIVTENGAPSGGGGIYADASTLTISGGEISNNKTAITTIEECPDECDHLFEDFDGNYFACYGASWSFNGWYLSGDNPHSGSHCYEARDGGSNDYTWKSITLTVNLPVDCVLSFWRKCYNGTSIGLGGDGLGGHTTFDLDHTVVYNWFGQTPSWVYEIVHIPAGEHTLQWYYRGVYTWDPATNAAWIDDIRLEPVNPYHLEKVYGVAWGEGHGGGIYADNGSPILITNGTNVSQNTATINGGGIYAEGGEVSVSGSVNDNTARNSGGGIYSNGGDVTMNGSVNDNTAWNNGGGIFSNGGDVTMSGTINNNRALGSDEYIGDGGGIYLNGGTNGATLDFSGNACGNTAANNGGGFYTYNCETSISDGSAVNKNTAVNGGGIYIANGGELTMGSCSVSENKAISDGDSGGDGGGIYVEEDGTTTATNATVNDNKAWSRGGGFYVDNGTTNATGGSINSNEAPDGGGGLYLDHGSLSYQQGSVDDNKTFLTEIVDFTFDELEGFETGTLDSYDWHTRGANPWTVVSDEAHEGHYSVKAGGADCGDLYVTMYIPVNGAISFYRKQHLHGGYISQNGTSTSESCINGLYFFIDGELIRIFEGGDGPDDHDNCSDWTRWSYQIPAGEHTFLWRYREFYYGDRVGDDYSYLEDDWVWIDDIRFGLLTNVYDYSESGEAQGCGAGVYADGSTVEIDGSIDRNTATVHGGGIYATSNASVTADATVDDNKARYGNGGGIFAINNGSVTLSGSASRNTAALSGGGIYATDNIGVSVNSTTVDENRASGGLGGGICITNGSSLNGRTGSVSNNTAMSHGGGIYVDSGTTTLNGYDVSYNTGGTAFAKFYNTNANYFEGFESGDFNTFDWQLEGNTQWYIVLDQTNWGYLCARSGPVNRNNATNSISTTLDIPADCNLSFLLKTQYDQHWQIKFYIDGTQMGSWSNVADWTLQSIPVTQGTHTFKWASEYTGYKTNGYSGNYAFIDNITFANIPNPEEIVISEADGGGVYHGGGSLQFDNGFIDNNTSTRKGGGLCAIGGTATSMSKSSVSNNTAARPVKLPESIDFEGFEVGDFSSFNWEFDDDQEWTVVTDAPNSGTYCAKSGAVEEHQSSTLTLTKEIPVTSYISFFKKIFSNNSGSLIFYINDVEIDRWTGGLAWNQHCYPLTAGTYTFKWKYERTEGSGGSNCAWIDDITFGYLPPDFETFETEGDGGGIYQVGGSIVSTNKGNVKYNVAMMGKGGGVYATNTSNMDVDAFIDCNRATGGNGGGVYAVGNGPVTISGSASHNTTPGEGGGIYATTNASMTVNASVDDNEATGGNGGGLYLIDDGAVTMNGSASRNNAALNGGGIYTIGGTMTMAGSIDNNVANQGSGGGIYADGTDITYTTGSVSDNTAINGHGGGIYLNEGSLNQANTAISSNTVQAGNGGGIYLNNCTTSIQNGTIGSNEAFDFSSNAVSSSMLLEDFESNTWGEGWTHSGSSGFTTSSPHSGTYSMNLNKGGAVTFTYDFPTDGELSFFYLAANNDYRPMTVYVDGVDKGQYVYADANNGMIVRHWQQAAVPVPAGTHVIRWYQASGGYDGTGVWSNCQLDDIRFCTYVNPDITGGIGGGIYVEGGQTTITGGTVGGDTYDGGNVSAREGGGIYVDSGDVTFTDVDFSHNKTTEGNGGGLYLHKSQMTIVGGNIEYNQANKVERSRGVDDNFSDDFEEGFTSHDWQFGGNADWTIDSTHIYMGKYCARAGLIETGETTDLILTAEMGTSGSLSFFYKVTAEGNRNCLEFYIDGARQDYWSADRENGYSSWYNSSWREVYYNVSAGSHVFMWRFTLETASNANQTNWAYLDHVKFTSTVYDQTFGTHGYGGGLFAEGGTFTYTNGTIAKNSASVSGGGLYLKGSEVTCTNSTVTDNTATADGGGIFMLDCEGTVNGGTIGGNDDEDGNTAVKGGGVFLNNLADSDNAINYTGVTFSHNQALANGGGIYLSGEGSRTVNISGNTIEYNKALGINAGDSELNFKESFESGDFGSFDWQLSGYAPWTISTEDPHSGTYCAHVELGGNGGGWWWSDATAYHNRKAELVLNLDVPADGTISFYVKTRPDNGGNSTYFHIDGYWRFYFNSSMDWTRYEYPINAGHHTLKWEYHYGWVSIDDIQYTANPPVAFEGMPTTGNGGGLYTEHDLTLAGLMARDNMASNSGGGLYISNGINITLQDHVTFTGNHVPALGHGGGIFDNGQIYLGRGHDDAVGSHWLKCDDNYAANDPAHWADSLNNIYLASIGKYVTLKSDVSSKTNGLYDTRMGFSVPANTAFMIPVVYVESANDEPRLQNLMSSYNSLEGSVFDDSHRLIAVHTQENIGSFNKQYIYLVGCWTTVVNHDPNSDHTSYPLPEGVESHWTNDGNTYHIYTNYGLAWFSSLVNGLNRGDASLHLNTFDGPQRGLKAELENNVDMSMYLWTPLGSVSGYNPDNSWFTEATNQAYTGEFEGNGYLIKGIINGFLSGVTRYGLFGAVGNNATVKNTFLDTYYNYASNSDLDYQMGGITGIGTGGTIFNCEARGNIEFAYAGAGSCAGGLVGTLDGTTLHSCMAMPTIKGTKTIGGLVGYLASGNAVSNCFSNVKFTTPTNNSGNVIGGLVGNSQGTVENCYVRMQKRAQEPNDFGWFASAGSGTFKYCYAPEDKNNYGPVGISLIGQGNYGNTTLVNGKYGFGQRDQQISGGSTDYVVNGFIGNDGELTGLLSTLNKWVDTQTGGGNYSRWSRTMASTINDDYPVLEFDDFVCVGSKDGVFMEYDDDLNDKIDKFNNETSGWSSSAGSTVIDFEGASISDVGDFLTWTNDFTECDILWWYSSGDYGVHVPWTISSNNPHSGSFCLATGEFLSMLDEDENWDGGSGIKATVNLEKDMKLSFYSRISAEYGYGYFYLDGYPQEMADYSEYEYGVTDWTEHTFFLSEGQHELVWAFTDSYYEEEEGRYYIDDISFTEAEVFTLIDFEDGQIPGSWEQSFDYPDCEPPTQEGSAWMIMSDQFHSGSNSMASVVVTDENYEYDCYDLYLYMNATIECETDGYISFWGMVTSYWNAYGYFYLDGEKQYLHKEYFDSHKDWYYQDYESYWEWEQHMFPVSAGTHELKWEFQGYRDSDERYYVDDVAFMTYDSEESGGPKARVIYLYATNPEAISTNSSEDVKVYIAPNVGVLQTAENTLNARVGVGIDNSSDYSSEADWHMFSSALNAAPMGLKYTIINLGYGESDPEYYDVGYPLVENYYQYVEGGLPHNLYKNRDFRNPPRTRWYDVPGKIGYFPTDTPYGPWRSMTAQQAYDQGLESHVGYFDFYTYSESHRQFINFKRGGLISGIDPNGNGKARDLDYEYNVLPDHWRENPDINGNHPHIPYVNETEMVPGRGYYVALSEPSMFMCDGVLNNVDVQLEVTTMGGTVAGTTDHPKCGLNLVGNPYQSYLDFDAFAAEEANSELGIDTYYIIDEDANGYVAYNSNQTPQSPQSFGWLDAPVYYTTRQFLHPHQGFYIKLDKDHENVSPSGNYIKFTNDMRHVDEDAPFRTGKPSYPLVNLVCTDDKGMNEFATVEVDRPEIGGSKKITDLHKGDASMWLHPIGGDDYQIAFTKAGTKRVPVHFMAYKDGVFTMRWSTLNANFGYLHLIDNIMGVDIDCLTEKEYAFVGTTEDYTSRFVLVFDPTEDEEEPVEPEPEPEDDGSGTGVSIFAFQINDQLMVNGEGTLQMFDIQGRCLLEKGTVGAQSAVSLPRVANGVYVLRLIKGQEVKTQKIVINKW